MGKEGGRHSGGGEEGSGEVREEVEGGDGAHPPAESGHVDKNNHRQHIPPHSTTAAVVFVALPRTPEHRLPAAIDATYRSIAFPLPSMPPTAPSSTSIPSSLALSWTTWLRSSSTPSGLILPVTALEFSPAAPHDLAAASSTAVLLFDSATLSPKLFSPLSSFSDIAYSPSFRCDGALLAAGGESGIVQVFCLDHAGHALRHLRAHSRPFHLVRSPSLQLSRQRCRPHAPRCPLPRYPWRPGEKAPKEGKAQGAYGSGGGYYQYQSPPQPAVEAYGSPFASLLPLAFLPGTDPNVVA